MSDALKCYCCGEPLGKTFCIVAYKGSDRGFFVATNHVERVRDKCNTLELKVEVQP
jgi:hypothetical protein